MYFPQNSKGLKKIKIFIQKINEAVRVLRSGAIGSSATMSNEPSGTTQKDQMTTAASIRQLLQGDGFEFEFDDLKLALEQNDVYGEISEVRELEWNTVITVDHYRIRENTVYQNSVPRKVSGFLNLSLGVSISELRRFVLDKTASVYQKRSNLFT